MNTKVPTKKWPFSHQLLAQRSRSVVEYVAKWMGLTEESAAKYMEQERARMSD